MIEEVRARIPPCLSWWSVVTAHSLSSISWDNMFLNRCGVERGAQLGPLLSSLTLHPTEERTKREVLNLNMNVWYMENGTLCCNPKNLFRALGNVEEDGPARGLFLNKKCSSMALQI